MKNYNKISYNQNIEDAIASLDRAIRIATITPELGKAKDYLELAREIVSYQKPLTAVLRTFREK